MTLFYDSENDFCDRHPRLCTSEVPGINLVEEALNVIDDRAEYDEQLYERYELNFESDRPEFCAI